MKDPVESMGLKKLDRNCSYMMFLPGASASTLNGIMEKIKLDPNMPKMYIFGCSKEELLELNDRNIEHFIDILMKEKMRRKGTKIDFG